MHGGGAGGGASRKVGACERAGPEADLVVVDGNPLDDYRVFFEPRLVISNGKVVIEGYGL